MKSLARSFLVFGSFFLFQNKINASDQFSEKLGFMIIEEISWILKAQKGAAPTIAYRNQMQALEIQEADKMAQHLQCSENIDSILAKSPQKLETNGVRRSLRSKKAQNKIIND